MGGNNIIPQDDTIHFVGEIAAKKAQSAVEMAKAEEARAMEDARQIMNTDEMVNQLLLTPPVLTDENLARLMYVCEMEFERRKSTMVKVRENLHLQIAIKNQPEVKNDEAL